MNTIRHFRWAALGAACLLPALASAATWYVRPGASGDNSGRDWSNALPALPTNFQRGDVYYIAAGLYPARTFATPASGSATITIRKATAADHGTSTGWSSAYGSGQAVFGGGWNFKSPNWVIDGQTGGGAANGWAGSFGIKIVERGDDNAVINVGQEGNADNVTIRHVEMVGKGSVSSAGGSYSNDGLAVYGATNVTLSYFRMTGIGRCPLFVSPKNLVVEHGWVESYNGSGAVHSEVASIWKFAGDRVGDVTFRHNLVTDIRSTGGVMWDNSSNPSARLLVYGNVFYRPEGARWEEANGVVGGWTGNGGEEFHNAKVYNNAFINVDQAPLSSLPRVASNNEAYNNIFYNSDSPNFSRFARHDYNVFINAGGTQGESKGVTDSVNPFVDIAGKDFRLKKALPTGMPLPAPFNVDALGLTRGDDGVFERGPFEFVTGAASVAAPTGLKAQ